MKNNIQEKLYNQIKGLQIIDTHEHIPHERDCACGTLDVFDFFTPYICDNLCSAGVTAELWAKFTDKSIPITERLKGAFSYIEDIRFTTYFKAFEQSVKTFGEYEFSLDGLVRAGEVLSLNNRLESVYARINAECGMTFMGYYGTEYFCDSKYLKVVPTVSQITPKTKEDVVLLSSVSGCNVTDLLSLSKSIESLFVGYERDGVKNIKIGGSYNRVPDYFQPNIELATAQLSAICSGEINLDFSNGEILKNYDISPIKDLDNFVIDKCMSEAQKRGMNVIIHTGIHAWNKNSIKAVSASSLEWLIRKYSKVNIVLLHLGYPFIDDAILLAKYFQNVFLDMAWVNILDEKESKDIIKKLVELLPISKICAFGGDYCQPANILGAYEITVKHLAHAFSELVDNGVISFEDALNIISAWLYDNPKRIYGL